MKGNGAKWKDGMSAFICGTCLVRTYFERRLGHYSQTLSNVKRLLPSLNSCKPCMEWSTRRGLGVLLENWYFLRKQNARTAWKLQFVEQPSTYLRDSVEMWNFRFFQTPTFSPKSVKPVKFFERMVKVQNQFSSYSKYEQSWQLTKKAIRPKLKNRSQWTQMPLKLKSKIII